MCATSSIKQRVSPVCSIVGRARTTAPGTSACWSLIKFLGVPELLSLEGNGPLSVCDPGFSTHEIIIHRKQLIRDLNHTTVAAMQKNRRRFHTVTLSRVQSLFVENVYQTNFNDNVMCLKCNLVSRRGKKVFTTT